MTKTSRNLTSSDESSGDELDERALTPMMSLLNNQSKHHIMSERRIL